MNVSAAPLYYFLLCLSSEPAQPALLTATSVGVMLDFAAGFNPPRHLYTNQLFRVWGAVPYGSGDHLTNAVFDFVR